VRRSLGAAALALCLTLAPLGSYAQSSPSDKDLAELEHYTLTMEKVTRFAQTYGDLAKLSKEHPELKNSLQSDSENHQKIADIEQSISAAPLIVETLKSHDFTPHEFVVLEFTLFLSAIAEGAKQQGADPAKLASEAHVNPANLAFIEQHKAELDELQKKYGLGQSD
jgi:DNA repair ATPase RecN